MKRSILQAARFMCVGVLSIVATAATAHAQLGRERSAPTEGPVYVEIDRVVVVLEGMSCSTAPGLVWVVIDDDGVERRAEKDQDRWVWNAPKPLPVNLAQFHATVRFPTGRTECRKPLALANDPKDPRKLVATFSFPRCNEEPVWSVTIGTTQTTHVYYVRTLLGTSDERSADCNERVGFATDHTEAIKALWFPLETLRVRLGWDPTKRIKDTDLLVFSRQVKAAPLLILSSDPKGQAGLVFNPKVQKRAKKSGDELSRTDIVDVLEKQRLAVNGRTLPSFRIADDTRLEGAGLETLVLKVK